MLQSIPKRLYRYQSVYGDRLEWLRRLLLGSELYFPSSATFNDPLDCRVPPAFAASKLDIEHHWRGVAKRNFPALRGPALQKRIKQLVLKSRTREGQKQFADEIIEGLQKHGVACFTTDPLNMLMWSYYAAGHQGVAVRFDMDLRNLAALPQPATPLDVRYLERFPVVNFYKDDQHQFMRVVLGTKAIAWSHEREWRLIRVGHAGPVQVPRAMVNGLILGMRIDPTVEETLRGWVASRRPKIELLRVVHKPGSFELELAPADRPA